jgi:hypothetical protein
LALSPEQLGPWRIAMSSQLHKPFFFNTVTQTGQFLLPKDLQRFGPTAQQDHANELDVESTAPLTQLAEDTVYTQYYSRESSEHSPLETTNNSINATDYLLPSPIEVEPIEELNVDCDKSPEEVSRSQDTTEKAFVPHSSTDTQLDAIPIPSSQLAANQWICDACTYINSSKRRPKCEMCGTLNPAYFVLSTKPSRSQRSSPSSYNESALFRASTSSLQSQSTAITPQRKRQKKT